MASSKYKLRERSEPKLSPTNLLEVLKALYRVRSKWYYVGLALGISSDTLDCIEQDENKVIGRLKEALKEWLQGNGKECTWNVIVNALKEAPVRAVSLAATLKRRHCKGQHCRGASKHAVPVTERVAGKDTDYERGLNLKCLCGQSAKLFTSGTSTNNPGRKFYRCQKPRSDQCDFRVWATIPCSCGENAPLKRTKKGANKGRLYFSCPRQSPKHQFFVWAEKESWSRGTRNA